MGTDTRDYTARRYIPEGSTVIEEAGAIVYQYDRGAQFCAVGYIGKARKSAFHYVFATDGKRHGYVTRWLEQRREYEDRKRIARARAAVENAAPHSLEIGDILYYSWGYDQTNCEFYQVIARTAHTVTIREIASKWVRANTDMSDYRAPVKDAFLSPLYEGDTSGVPMVKRVKGESVSMEFGSASRWDGQEKYNSWYA